jgi:hypothetical protein
VSSILEALRELETRQPPATQTVAVAEPQSERSPRVETIGVIAIGLVVGALAFGVVLWLPDALTALASKASVPQASVEKAPAVAGAPAEPRPARPAWLENADPPRARVATTPAGTTPDRPARIAETPHPRPAAGRAGAPVEVAGIEYSDDVSRRSVALRIDGGEPVRLHEHESAGGVEVQLIEADGVYVRRGGEVVRLAP